MTATAKVDLPEGAVVPNLKPGNIADRVATIAGLRRAMEQVGARGNARNANLTLVIPDAAVRVLLLDFDSLPNKLSEALPIVRFRLKKLLPFEADEAMISFQIMSTSRTMVRVLAVAIPRDVLSEYESIAREAGFEPGAVLPSTLAALAGLNEGEGASLVVNAHSTGVTTAIVRGGILQLHRTVELAGQAPATPASLPPELFERSPNPTIAEMLALVDPEETAGEWAAQEPLPEFGRNPYADRLSAEMAVEDRDGITDLPLSTLPFSVRQTPPSVGAEGPPQSTAMNAGGDTRGEAELRPRYPYAAPGVTSDLQAELHQAVLRSPSPLGAYERAEAGGGESQPPKPTVPEAEPELRVHGLAADVQAEEIAQAVSVAVAYFEDSLGTPPAALLSAGPLSADDLLRTLREQGVAQADGLRTRELVEVASLATQTVSASVPRGWLAGVVGALQS